MSVMKSGTSKYIYVKLEMLLFLKEEVIQLLLLNVIVITVLINWPQNASLVPSG